MKRNVGDVCMPMGLVYEALVKAGRLESRQRKEKKIEDQEKCFCQYHGRTMDYSIQKCRKFLELVQEMMNEGEIELCGKMEEQNVSVLQRKAPKPVTNFYRGGGQQASREVPRFPSLRLVVKVPALFRYTSDKTVPLNYTSQAVV